MKDIIMISGYFISIILIVLLVILKKKKDKIAFELKSHDTSLFLYDITFSDVGFLEKLKNISNAIMSRIEFDYVSFFILDPDKNVGIIHSTVPEYDRIELNVLARQLLIEKDRPVIMKTKDHYLEHGRDRYIKYAYFVPLKENGETIGGILLEKENHDNISKIEDLVFESIVSAASKAFSFIIFAYKLNESAYKDVLTGTLNKKALEDHEDTLDGKYTAVMCDIDFFKKVNDTYGHDAGDEVLKLVANILMKSVRLGDQVIRMGGEEFMMLLKNVETNQYISRINDVRKSIEEHKIIYDGQEIRVTASFGLADTTHTNSLHELKILSDKALYYSKETGRNKATVFREGMR
jgi:diguanylate cyclase (GGDEF)-like protein